MLNSRPRTTTVWDTRRLETTVLTRNNQMFTATNKIQLKTRFVNYSDHSIIIIEVFIYLLIQQIQLNYYIDISDSCQKWQLWL